MPFLHPPYFLIWGLQHASNLNLRSPSASQDGFGEQSISSHYSSPLWGMMAQDQRLSPHEDFNGPNILSLQITAESLMQFWPDFDAALYWCGVTPQQSNKVRSQQWLSWSSWKDAYLPCVQGGGWARRKVPAQSSLQLPARRAQGEGKMLFKLCFAVPHLWKIILACSAAEVINQSWNLVLSSITLASWEWVAALRCVSGLVCNPMDCLSFWAGGH